MSPVRRPRGRPSWRRPARLRGRPDLPRPDRRQRGAVRATSRRPAGSSSRAAPRRPSGRCSPTGPRRRPTSASPGTASTGCTPAPWVPRSWRPSRSLRRRTGSTYNARPGLMEKSDLRAYDALGREPTHVGYRGLDVYGMAPPSSGGSTVGEALNILERSDLSAMDRTLATHYYLEASALAFADRNRYVGDPAEVGVPLGELLSDSFAAERSCPIDPSAAANKPVPAGAPDGAYVTDCPARTTPRRAARRPGRPVDDAPDGGRQVGKRGRVHADHRADRRQRHRRPQPRVPAQQRAHRLQLRADGAGRPQPAGAGQAAALVDGADDRPRRRPPGPRRRLARGVDHHHDGAADPGQPPGLRDVSTARRWRRPEPASATRLRSRPSRRSTSRGSPRSGTRSSCRPRRERSGRPPPSSSPTTEACSRSPSRCAAAVARPPLSTRLMAGCRTRSAAGSPP